MLTKKILKESLMDALSNKEIINPDIFAMVKSKSHYLANNFILPKVLGDGSYIEMSSNDHFKQIVNQFKRTFSTNDINPECFHGNKNDISDILNSITEIEKHNNKAISNIAISILNEVFNVPDSIKFIINQQYNDVIDGNDILQQFEKKSYDLNSYDCVDNFNKTIDRDRLTYSIIVGGSMYNIDSYKKWENALDSIDYRLYDLYNKVTIFNKYHIWVTPDEILLEEFENNGDFKIYNNNGEYTINITAPNLLGMLYEGSKAILSILFGEKYCNEYIDYNNVWNSRLGYNIWKSFISKIPNKKHLPQIISKIRHFSDDDFDFVFKEILSNTKHSKIMLQNYCNSLK